MKPKDIQWQNVSAFSKAEESPGYLLWTVNTAWRRNIEEGLATLDITHTQFVLLASIGFLTKRGKNVYQIELAQHAQLHVAMTSQVIRTLQKKGYITRVHKAGDQRSKHAALTTQGCALLEKAVPLVESIDAAFFSPLSAQEQTTYLALMAKLASHKAM